MVTLKKKGNCFEIHGKMMLDRQIKGFIIVHGEISGQKQLNGLRIAHCWLEKDGMVYDLSNGRHIITTIEHYYDLGKVINEPGKLHKYSRMKMAKMLLKHKNWGCWELTCEL